MRLCLDQHYAPRIATLLRDRGHDVVAAEARGGLRGVSDAELLDFSITERRALLTENVADFMPLAHQLADAGDDHYGLVFSSPASMPRGADTIGLFVEALDCLLRDHPSEDALRNQIRWLRPPR